MIKAIVTPSPSGDSGRTGGRSFQIEERESFNPFLRGWISYYGKFYRSKLASILGQLDYALQRWAKRKFKRLKGSPTKARTWLRGGKL